MPLLMLLQLYVYGRIKCVGLLSQLQYVLSGRLHQLMDPLVQATNYLAYGGIKFFASEVSFI